MEPIQSIKVISPLQILATVQVDGVSRQPVAQQGLGKGYLRTTQPITPYTSLSHSTLSTFTPGASTPSHALSPPLPAPPGY
ncbi:hypothetical protein E2C01_064517 [Portunus trituberculatus]|uniref:Uncharacterized protein n=1 Tax=Portunus trituberculatus TaxID=210409 RepID=A0A5B7HL19_PORTR|nr:hypothetical protein [Portunus trituberculatus]